MPDGFVKFYNPARGYGFILSADGGPDIFMHAESLKKSGLVTTRPDGSKHTVVTEGTKLTFDIEPGKQGKGPKAVNLQIVA